MAYIGREPQIGNFQVCDAISVVNGQAAYTMQVNSTNVSPETAFHVLCSLNGVLQKPGSSFTVSGSTITFASNLATGDVIDFIQILGSTLDLGVPSNDTVGAAQIKDDLISGTTALASEPADTDEFLVSDAGTLKRIDYSLIKGGGITEFDQWRLTAAVSGSQDPISSNFERSDTPTAPYIGTGMSQSSGIFTFPSTGIWKIETVFLFYKNDSSSNGNMYGHASVTTNNSSYADIIEAVKLEMDGGISAYGSMIFDVTNTTTHKVRFKTNVANSGDQVQGNTARNLTYFTFTRMGDT